MWCGNWVAMQFDYLARAFRARLDVFPIAFGRINASLWDREDFYNFTSRYEMIKPNSPFTGMVMDKQNDDKHFFRHRWNHLTMSSWIYTKQFNYLVRCFTCCCSIFQNGFCRHQGSVSVRPCTAPYSLRLCPVPAAAFSCGPSFILEKPCTSRQAQRTLLRWANLACREVRSPACL